PAETFPCSEVVFRYILDNDSGMDRENITLSDSLDEGFLFLDTLTELKSGELKTAFPSNNIEIDQIIMGFGKDTIDLLVYVGDVNPDEYFNRSQISGFHSELGVLRTSDDPRTQFIDSTLLTVKGTRSDSTFIKSHICENEVIELNGADYGKDLLWPNGSKDSIFTVREPGVFELQVFDGCENAFVFFEIEPALDIDIDIPESEFEVHVGDSILISPFIVNEGNYEDYSWNDPADTTLSCPICLTTYARPFDDIIYMFYAENEMCRDSIELLVKVDKTRRIYIPNIFTPNGDAYNDRLFIQSPVVGIIHQFVVYDQWGSEKFRSDQIKMNDPHSGWRPFENGYVLPSGVYTYMAEIEFIDKVIEVFTGTITLIN
ncbi:MAG: gliding motility-associated C-terminal domain-containing protein, partial [Bacteroidia bacterium]|nr:gliding motility-associated C-terminal domain-containing protein [Bacteroidia bacterium]